MEDVDRNDVGALVGTVEEAKRDLLAAVPSPRGLPARSIADALLAFEEGLRRAVDLIPVAGRDPSRDRLAEGIEESLRRAERLRLDAPSLDYEGLVAVLADLIEPLEVFADPM